MTIIMKKILSLFVLAFSANCFSQTITVDTNKYTVPELVNTVLINSPCVSATNVTSKTGSNFGSSNGIGYFKNTNPNFPMKSGVILSTGDVNHAAGPNNTEQNGGSANWSGDSSLENTLSLSGISMKSINASVIEFDFTPISSAFNFEFLFASEEYGNFQCQFSDAFAFLLTNTITGATTNLAVVPNTNLPISVVTIRDLLYNSSCPSVNAQYFGSYNGGSAAAGSATNFNGQTTLMNAFATLIPNTPYHIKLVIADRSDSGSDSAIFISSDSFNIGQDVLGLDLTVANNTAVCHGSTQVLTTNLDPAIYSFSWTKNGVRIPGATGPNLNVTSAANYGVTYSKITNSCQPITDYIKVEYLPQIITKNPTNIYKCDTGASSYTYDLSYNTSIVKTGLNPSTEVSYHISLDDATSGINALPTSYTSPSGQTIYVRIKNYNNSCFTVKSFQLLTTPVAVAYQPADMIQCATTITSTSGVFKLSNQNSFILKGQSSSVYSVSYYISQSNANDRINPLNLNSYVGTNNTIIYARVENIYDTICYSTTNFKIIVNPLPLVDKLEDIETCVNFTLPVLTNGNYFTGPNGTGIKLFAGDSVDKAKTIYIFNQPDGPKGCSASSNFKITIIDEKILDIPKDGTYCKSFVLPACSIGGYYSQPDGGGEKIAFGTKVSSTNSFYYYIKSKTDSNCKLDKKFTITIIPNEDVDQLKNIFDCNSYTLPTLTTGNYYTQPDGGGTKLTAGTVITTSQKIYVYSTSGSPNYCSSQSSFDIAIGLKAPSDINQCNSYTLPALTMGKYYTGPAGTGSVLATGTVISETSKIYIYFPTTSTPNCTDNLFFNVIIGQPKIDILENVNACETYTLPVLVNGGAYYTGTNETGTKLNAGDIITSSKNIYIYKRTSGTCNNESNFLITINKKPEIDSRSDIDICNFYELTPLKNGNYYTGPGGTGTKLLAGTIIKTSQTIYIYATSKSTSACSDENSFKINIFSIEADSPANVTICDSYTLPSLKIGNYYSLPGGPSGKGSLMHAGDVITSTKTIYVYTESGERINCTDENSFIITINHTPVVAAISDVYAYDSFKLPNLAVGNYFTGTNGSGTQLKEGDIIKSNQTLYVFAQTATTPNCFDQKSFKIDLFNVDELSNVTICENYILPVLKVGNYYSGPKATGIKLYAGQKITSSQTIYIYGATPLIPIGYDESSFVVTIVDTPIAYPVPSSLTTLCDEDGNNDGITTFDLTLMNATILGNQTSSEFIIKYYATQADAATEMNPITSSNLPTVYVRVNNTLTKNCFDLKPIAIKVIKVPNPNPKGGIICYESKTKTVLNSYIINSGLSASTHFFKWLDETKKIVGTASTYEAKLPGIYTLIATSKATGCHSFPIGVEVLPSEPAKVTYTISDDFANEQILTIQATGVGGDYEYQLDFGPFQDSPVFQDLATGTHNVTVRDKNGCGNTETKVLVVNYPKYFTPNGDGVNDTWNITSLENQTNSIISIYDRYGKKITEIKPTSEGWDGSYTGQILPASDYWFTINYIEDGIAKEFKSHFSMKR